MAPAADFEPQGSENVIKSHEREDKRDIWKLCERGIFGLDENGMRRVVKERERERDKERERERKARGRLVLVETRE